MEYKLEIDGSVESINLHEKTPHTIEFCYKNQQYNFGVRKLEQGRWILEDVTNGTLFQGFIEKPDTNGGKKVFSEYGDVTVAPIKKVRKREVAITNNDTPRAPLSGIVRSISVRCGDIVRPQQVVALLEVMKMQVAVVAPKAGRVEKILVKEGDQVNEGIELMVIVPAVRTG
jgi:biotin carboxyl carrier protein